jgi:hypothetical protein
LREPVAELAPLRVWDFLFRHLIIRLSICQLRLHVDTPGIPAELCARLTSG